MEKQEKVASVKKKDVINMDGWTLFVRSWMILSTVICVALAVAIMRVSSVVRAKDMEILALQQQVANLEAKQVSYRESEKANAMKQDLLAKYVDFVFLPTNADAKKKNEMVDAMEEKVIAINDAELIAKYNATGEKGKSKDDRVKSIVELFHYLIGGSR